TKPGAKPEHKKHSTSSKQPFVSSKEATKGGSSKAPTGSKTSHSKKRKESSLAMDSNLSQPLVYTPIDTGMHKEDQQATGGPTSLGVTSEARANPQLSSGMSVFNLNESIYLASFIILSESASGNDASSASTAEANLRNSTSSDFVPQQQGMNEGTKNTSHDRLFVGADLHVLADHTKYVSEGLETVLTQPITGKRASLVSKQIKEETYSTIKLEDLAKLVSHVQPSFKDLDSPKDDLIIVVDDSDEDEDDEVHATQNVKTKDTLVPKSPSHCSLPTKIKDRPSKFDELTEKVKELQKQVYESKIELPGDLKEIPTKLDEFTKTVTSLTSQVAELKTLQRVEKIVKDNLNKNKPQTKTTPPPIPLVITTTTTQMQYPFLQPPSRSSSQPEGEHIKEDKGKKDLSLEEAEKESIDILGMIMFNSYHRQDFVTIEDLKDFSNTMIYTVQEIFFRRHQYPRLDDHARAFNSLLLVEADKRNLNLLKQIRVIEQLRGRLLGLVPEPFSLLVDLNIKSSKSFVDPNIQSKESTLQVVYDVLRQSLFFKAFLVTEDVPEIYMQEFWATATVHQHSIRFKMDTRKHIVNLEAFREMLHISPRVSGQSFTKLPFEEEILEFFRFLGHSAQIKTLTDDPSIPRRNKVNWHYVRDDQMFTTIKLVSRHQNIQQFGAMLPIELTNEDIKNFEAYKEYYAVATGATPPKTKASVWKTKSSFDTIVTPLLTAAAGTRLSTSAKGKQPAKASKAKSLIALSEKSSDEEEDDDVDEGSDDQDDVDAQDDDDDHDDENKDDDDQDKGDDDDDQEEGSDDEQDSDEEGEEFIHPNLSIHNEEETRDEESFDPIAKTPKNTDDKVAPLPLSAPTLTHSTTATISTVPQAPTPLTTAPSTLLQDLPNFGLLFGFDHQLKTLEANFSEFVQTNQFARASVNEQLEDEVLTRSSNSSKTSYAVAADLLEMELKKILIKKMEGNKSIYRSNEQRNLYKDLVKAYESNKIILHTYGDTVMLKRRRDDDTDKDEEPSAGSDRGSKRRKEGKEPESASAPKEKATRSADKSTQGSKSR
nr:hypothetical protein [Tanacetum cinerariifolium]